MQYDTNRPIYLQVIEDISRKMIRGDIQLGDKLPSVRELSVQYQINPNTASRVYKEMEQRSLCFIRRGTGTFITEDAGVLKQIRSEMAAGCLDTFLQDMELLGLSFDEMVQMLRERYERKKDNA